MSDLDFIEDTALRKTLDNSIDYIYALFKQSKDKEQTELYKEETNRVIILYVVSAIEAVLLYFYKVRGEKITYPEYRFVESLPERYIHKDKEGSPVVVAVQETMEKKEHQIGLHDLATFFKEKKLIQEKTVGEILELNALRNTFHFNKPRTEFTCDLNRVESALQLLVRTLQNAPKALGLKKKI